MNRRVQKKGGHSEWPFDRYALYQKAVQSPDSDAEFIQQVYKEHRSKEPITLREDFCGTFAISCEWVKLHKKHHSIGVDFDPEPLEYGWTNNAEKLNTEQKLRVKTYQRDVLKPGAPKADIVLAANFSYFIFQTRTRMLEYFKKVRQSLNSDGIFMLDIFGGSLCHDANEENSKHKGFTYYWQQEDFDPLTNRAKFAINFKLQGQKKLNRVFTYDWRMWSIPELREILEDAGFSNSHVYWEGTKRDGTGNGIFKKAVVGEACQSWIAYIVAEK